MMVEGGGMTRCYSNAMWFQVMVEGDLVAVGGRGHLVGF